MRKQFFILSLAFLVCSIISISFPSDSAAGSPLDDQHDTASFLQLKSTGPESYGIHAAAEKTGETDTSHAVSIPVKSGINAFFDFARSNAEEMMAKKNGMDFRTVFGFHITLK